MRMHKFSILTIMLVIIISACTSFSREETDSEEKVANNNGTTTLSLLVQDLISAGGQVEVAGAIEQPFFPISGKILRINGQDVQVFKFDSTDQATEIAATISPDGSSIGTSMVGWIAPPHFFLKGSFLAIYIGQDSNVILALESAMGAQFAGQ